MSWAGLWTIDPAQACRPAGGRVATALRSAAPALLFGLRLWAAVCLALYVAFWLQLDNAYWAGTSAAVVCQPSLGASLRKAWFRMVGTEIGAVVIVVLTARFPQDRTSFLLGLALWGAACALVATLLRNFAGYAAALAGLTAAVIASDELGAVGGANNDVFMFAIARASEICIGIICAGVVLASTDFGGARHRLAAQLATISAEIVERLTGTFLLVGPKQSKTRPVRRDLIRRVTALDPVIDEALGESSDLRPHSPALEAAAGGLFAALSGWRTAAVHLELLRSDNGLTEADIVLENIPPELRSVSAQEQAASWTRSLADFAKLVEAFDARSISFVAVTQQFNTTTSMGRLTLNVLLSFAQFERELSSERVRDKIAASRRKGKWTGGTVPLGYDAKDKKLVVNQTEAETVRTIFHLYPELKSFSKLVGELDRRGIVTKRRSTKVAKYQGGIPLTYGPLAYFLKNRVYLGEIHHGGEWFEGEHEAIIDRATFDRVQKLLATKSNGQKAKRSESGALLLGKLYDDRGNLMSPSFSSKNGVRYRFYVSSALLRGRKATAGSVGRVPAAEIENAVLAALKAHQGRTESVNGPDPDPNKMLERVVVAREQLLITISSPDGPTDANRTSANKNRLVAKNEGFANSNGQRGCAGGQA